MSLQRLGVPEAGIQLWAAHDHTRKQHVRTAYGLTEGVRPRCGAFGQGAEESPMGIVSFMCWKCDYLFENEMQIDPYEYTFDRHHITREAKTIPLSKILFCDDSSYTASSMKGASELLKKIGLFAAAGGM